MFINQLQPGMNIEQVFLVRDKDLRTTNNGQLYISCTLVDRTGNLPARMWQANEAIYNAMPVDGFIQARGRTESYKGNLQFIVTALRPIKADKVDLSDFLAATEQDVEEMWGELVEILRQIKDPHLRLLIKKFMEDQDLVAAYKKSPAAMQMHHAFLGGLLEHTLGIARLAVAVCKLYPSLNADLLLAGVFLHDIGKTDELTRDMSFSYTDRGQLVGHITTAAIWVQQKAQAVAAETGEPFPEKTVTLLQHLILAHHGVHEYGSPKLPATPEAMALHYLDNLDAKMHMFFREIANDTDDDASFTSFQRQLDVRIYKRSHTLTDEAPGELFRQGEDVQ